MRRCRREHGSISQSTLWHCNDGHRIMLFLSAAAKGLATMAAMKPIHCKTCTMRCGRDGLLPPRDQTNESNYDIVPWFAAANGRKNRANIGMTALSTTTTITRFQRCYLPRFPIGFIYSRLLHHYAPFPGGRKCKGRKGRGLQTSGLLRTDGDLWGYIRCSAEHTPIFMGRFLENR